MPKNNFKLFDENKSNMMTDVDYNTNAQRLNGVQSGVASSQLQNKTLYQTALMCYALAQIMAANGYDANDADAVSTFVNNLSSTMVQKVKDRASELEVKTGAKVNKYITPGDFMTSLNYLTKAKYGEIDPTTSTEGTLGQIYVNTTTQVAFYCGKIEGNTFTWHRIARAIKKIVTEVISSDTQWIVPDGVSSVMVRAFGGGGGGYFGGSSHSGGGGGGGEMTVSTVQVTPKDVIEIVIGNGGTSGNDGGNTKFGVSVIANGGKHGSRNGGDGGSGGGGGSNPDVVHGDGGNGQYGGGGGAGGTSQIAAPRKGGNGGTYGGGGGGISRGSTAVEVATGGTYGGNGGTVNKNSSKIPENGTNTIGKGLDFEGEGKAGMNSNLSGGGGGGYGGNGGNANSYGCGGGGGYGANGGNGYREDGKTSGAGGGGGGYGGKGKDATSSGGGGGGGYGKDNYGSGGNSGESGSSGCIVLSYEGLSIL